MAIIQGLVALVFRYTGKIVNTAFGWATVMLFGKVPEKRQIYLSLISFGCVLWIIVALGILFPAVGTFLLSFVKLPETVNKNLVRLVMLGCALVLPLVVGILSLFMLDPEDRPKEFSQKLKILLKGYPYTFGLALTLLMMVIIAPLLKIRDLAKGWTSSHIPIVVESPDYQGVAKEIQSVLREGGFDTVPANANWLLRLPTKVLTLFAGSNLDRFLAGRLINLASPRLEALLHPSDLVLSGPKDKVARARAIITERLTFTNAYLTWDKEAQSLEDQMKTAWEELEKNANHKGISSTAAKLISIEDQMQEIKLPYEEWEILFREKLLLERQLLRHKAGLSEKIPMTLSKIIQRFRRSESRWLDLVSWATAAGLVTWRKTQKKETEQSGENPAVLPRKKAA